MDKYLFCHGVWAFFFRHALLFPSFYFSYQMGHSTVLYSYVPFLLAASTSCILSASGLFSMTGTTLV